MSIQGSSNTAELRDAIQWILARRVAARGLGTAIFPDFGDDMLTMTLRGTHSDAEIAALVSPGQLRLRKVLDENRVAENYPERRTRR